jgi:branched-chain amino acid transport system substrate-binding protein
MARVLHFLSLDIFFRSSLRDHAVVEAIQFLIRLLDCFVRTPSFLAMTKVGRFPCIYKICQVARLRFFIVGLLLMGLTSCGHQPTPEMVTPPPSKTKPVTPSVVPTQPIEALTHKVGLLLPLTGPQASLGKGMLDAAEMALFEAGSPSITLLPQDTAQGAHQAALKALNEGAELLLGPIFAPEVDAIKPLLTARNVSLLCFSTDQKVAGGGAFILGFLPSQQMERVIGFAKEKGLTKMAALTPDDQYGHLIDQTLKHLEAQGNLHLLGITHYTKADILEGNPGNTRLLEEVAAYKAKGLDALVIPEGGENLAYLAKLLSPEMPLKILGSGQWDAPETLQNSALEGGLFASTDPQEHQNFEARFQRSYGYLPPRIVTLAYDATALAIALAEKGYTPQTLTFSQGFAGINGLFRLTPQGLNERGLAVLEVRPSGFIPLSPSPRSF